MTVHDCDSDAHALVDEGTCAAPVFYTPLPLDPDDYLPYLDGFDMSIEQKQAALFALWHIMSAIVDIGFGMDTIRCKFFCRKFLKKLHGIRANC